MGPATGRTLVPRRSTARPLSRTPGRSRRHTRATHPRRSPGCRARSIPPPRSRRTLRQRRVGGRRREADCRPGFRRRRPDRHHLRRRRHPSRRRQSRRHHHHHRRRRRSTRSRRRRWTGCRCRIASCTTRRRTAPHRGRLQLFAGARIYGGGSRLASMVGTNRAVRNSIGSSRNACAACAILGRPECPPPTENRLTNPVRDTCSRPGRSGSCRSAGATPRASSAPCAAPAPRSGAASSSGRWRSN